MLRESRVRRALSLLEVTLALGVMGLLFWAAARALHWTTRSFGWMYLRSTLQQEMLVSLERLEADFRQTPTNGISLGQGDLVALSQIEQRVYPGDRAYKDCLIVYRRQTSQLLREQYRHSANWKQQSAEQLQPTQLQALLTNSPLHRALMTNSAAEFRCQTTLPWVTLRIKLVAQSPGRSVIWEGSRRLLLRNPG